MSSKVVVDANVLVAASISSAGHNRVIIRKCLERQIQPIVGETLFHEYESVLGRQVLFKKSPLTLHERRELFWAFLSVCQWVRVYYLWRPNLRDEGDNHLIELAVAGTAEIIVTNNVKDFRSAELQFPEVRILTPQRYLKEN